jgi:hypothetical protein
MFPFAKESNEDDGLDAARGMWNALVFSVVIWTIIIVIGYGVTKVW